MVGGKNYPRASRSDRQLSLQSARYGIDYLLYVGESLAFHMMGDCDLCISKTIVSKYNNY